MSEGVSYHPARPGGLVGQVPLAPEAHQDDPRRDIMIGAAAGTLFLIAVFGWGLWARLDAAVVAPGQVEVAGSRQSVQHRDGGVIAELPVHEGDHVLAGQLLVQLKADEAQASEQALADQVINLEALQARLEAELVGAHGLSPPADFAALSTPEKAAADAAMALQRRQFSVRNAALASERAILVQKGRESSQEITGFKRQVTASQDQQRLIDQEIASLQDLYARQLVPATRLRSLQRSAAELRGGEGEYSADIARTQEEIGESAIREADLQRQRASDDTKAYQESAFQLAELRPKLAAVRQQLANASVRAPVDGRVVGLAIFTRGGVVAPGEKLMDIVPDHQALVIEARVKPTDVADLKPGQSVEFRVGAFHERGLPALEGAVSKISADSFVDDKSGRAYFNVEVTARPSAVAAIAAARTGQPGLSPGLPVELIIPVRPRSALAYLLEPLRQAMWRSFRAP